MKALFKDARILKMDGSPLFRSNLVVNEDKIAYIGEDYEKYGPFNFIRECHGNVLMPTFKNVHTHSGMTFLRSKLDNLNLQDWLYNEVFPREEKLTPEYVYAFTKVAILEYLSSGIGAVLDQYFFGEHIAKAFADMNFRALVLDTLPSYSYTIEKIESLYRDNNNLSNGLVRFCFGTHAEYTCKEENVIKLSEFVHKYKAPFFTHLQETKKETDECYQRHNMSPTQYFESKGCFDYGGAGFHCVYFDDVDIQLFKKHNASIVTCPGSNCKLASGIAPIKKFLDAGVNVAIGTDGPSSNNCLDMFKEMTLVNHLAKVSLKDPTALDPYTVLKMATVNGSKVLGLDDCDILDVNKKADLIEIDLMRPNMQPFNDIVANIVYSGSKENVKLTMINGKILYRDHHFYVGEPISKIYQECQKACVAIDEAFKKSKENK